MANELSKQLSQSLLGAKRARYFVHFETGYSKHCPAARSHKCLIIKGFINQIQRTDSP